MYTTKCDRTLCHIFGTAHVVVRDGTFTESFSLCLCNPSVHVDHGLGRSQKDHKKTHGDYLQNLRTVGCF